MAIKHDFTSSAAEGSDANKVRTSNWNADHVQDPSVDYFATSLSLDDGLGNASAFTGTVSDIVNIDDINNVPNIYTEGAIAYHYVDHIFSTLAPITHIIARVRYLDGPASHSIEIKAWDYSGTPAWSSVLATISPSLNFQYIVIPLTSTQQTNFRSGTAGKIRFNHPATGSAGHLLEIDYVAFRYNPDMDESTSDPMQSRFIGVQTLTSASGTYTPTSGTAVAFVRGVGGGGGGGGAITASATTSMGGGGASGSEFERWIPIVSGQTCAYGCGTAGAAGGTTSLNIGGTGGATTFTYPIDNTAASAQISAPGGLGGYQSLAATTVALGTAGGPPGAIPTNNTGFVSRGGSPGGVAWRQSGTVAYSGGGGSSFAGAGGSYRNTAGAGNAAAANSGGGGGGAVATSTAGAGGAGGTGVIVVYEYS